MKNLNPTQEIQKRFEMIDQKMFYIDDLRYGIGCLINHLEDLKNYLEDIDADLLDCFTKLESAKELCCRFDAGEPIAILAELQRLGF